MRYQGSCKKQSKAEALEKAREAKRRALEMAGPGLGGLSGSGENLAAGFLCNRSPTDRLMDLINI